ncbi:heme/hemin ABC transporter substrate-binding protein [Bradymonas sediminis]|nr:ABC transporter substrate-binding protein [Bradymonas sediminis]
MTEVSEMTKHRYIMTLLVSITLGGVGPVGCDRPEPPPAQKAGATDEVAAAPDADAQTPRVVTIGGTITEIAFALGAGEQIVAADKSSVYPEEVKKIAVLDLFRNIAAEPIIAQDPTLILATDQTNPKDALARVKGAGVDVVEISEDPGVDQARQRIRDIADVLGRAQQADALIAKMDQDLEAASQKVSACNKPARTLFVYARGPNTVFVAGRDTGARALVELAGGEPVHGDFSDFKPMSAEAIVAANPDAILMTDGGLRSLGGLEGLQRVKGLGETAAVKNKRVITREDLALLGFGPRLGQVVLELTDDLCLDAAPSDE